MNGYMLLCQEFIDCLIKNVEYNSFLDAKIIEFKHKQLSTFLTGRRQDCVGMVNTHGWNLSSYRMEHDDDK